MKIKDLIELPEYKIPTIGFCKEPPEIVKIAKAKNEVVDEIGNIEVELDVKKVKEVIFDYLIRTQKERIIQQNARKFGVNTKVSENLAQAIADKFKDIIKK